MQKNKFLKTLLIIFLEVETVALWELVCPTERTSFLGMVRSCVYNFHLGLAL